TDRGDAVQFGLKPQGQRGLVFGMRVARDDEGERLEDGSDNGWIVLTEGLGGDEGAHVEEAVRLAGLFAIANSEVRSDGFAGIEGHRQREEEAARGGLKRCMRRRQMLLDQLLERALTVLQGFGHIRVHLAGAISSIELRHALEKSRDA